MPRSPATARSSRRRATSASTGAFGALLLNIFALNLPRIVHADTTPPPASPQARAAATQSCRRSPIDDHRLRRRGPDCTGLARHHALPSRVRDLPSASQQCAFETIIGNDGALDGPILPLKAHQRFVGRAGDEAEVVATFSDCRQFQGQSTVTFGAARGVRWQRRLHLRLRFARGFPSLWSCREPHRHVAGSGGERLSRCWRGEQGEGDECALPCRGVN